jgi:hypothetical protein
MLKIEALPLYLRHPHSNQLRKLLTEALVRICQATGLFNSRVAAANLTDTAHLVLLEVKLAHEKITPIDFILDETVVLPTAEGIPFIPLEGLIEPVEAFSRNASRTFYTVGEKPCLSFSRLFDLFLDDLLKYRHLFCTVDPLRTSPSYGEGLLEVKLFLLDDLIELQEEPLPDTKYFICTIRVASPDYIHFMQLSQK